MGNGIRASSPEFRTQVISGRCKLYLTLAIVCFGLLISKAYVIAQTNGIEVGKEIAKIRGGEYSKMPSPDEDSMDDDRIVTYEFRNNTERELLFLLKGRDEKALIVKPGSSASTDVRPGYYEVAVRGWKDDEHSVKPQYEILASAPGMLYKFTFSSVKIDPCSIIAEQDHIVPGQAVTFSGIVAPRVFNKDELEQAEYRFYFGDGNARDWSKEARAEHVYSEPGTYKAVLEVRSGDKKYTSHGVKITVDREPIAVSLRARPVNPVTGQVVVFRAVPEGDTEGVEYKFDFGDGKVRDWFSTATAEHAYSSPGRYTPYVIARIGEETLQSGEIVINVRRIPPIEVSLRARPVKPKTGENVSFSAVREVNVEGTEFQFDFGDGEVRDWSSVATANHAYDREGEYSASVKARLGDVVADSSPVIIQVMADYKVAIYAKSQRTREGDEVIFRQGDETVFRQGDEIVFGAVLTPEAYGASFRFVFGDNSPTDWTGRSEVKHAYSSPGRYTPYVIARIGEGTFQSGKIAINIAERNNIIISIVKHPRFGIILILLLLLAAGCYILSRIPWHKPSLQFNPRGDPGIQQVESDISIQSYPEIRLRSVLEPDKDRIEIEVSLTVGEEVGA